MTTNTTIKTFKTTIAAGAKESPRLILKAIADQSAEKIEVGSISVIEPPTSATKDYMLLSNFQVNESDTLNVRQSVDLHVYEKYVLYAKQNDYNNRDDDPNNNPVADGNPGIHLNDISQGGLGNCYFWAAIGSMVDQSWGWGEILAVFSNEIEDENGSLLSVTARLYNEPNIVSGFGTTLNLRHVEESPQIGDTIVIEGDPTAYTVDSVSNYDATKKEAKIILTRELGQLVQADGAVTITSNTGVRGWANMTVDVKLDQGFDQANSSYDYEHRELQNDYRYEIWPLMLEKAFAQMRGGYAAIANGSVTASWAAIRGPNFARKYVASNFQTATGFILAIEAAMVAGNRVVLSTPKVINVENPTANSIQVDSKNPNVNKEEIFGNHAYIVTSVSKTDDITKLYNPWGPHADKPWIGMDSLFLVSQGFYVLE